MHAYYRNLGDYAKKAGRLSILQHGVYNLLIDACYDREIFPTLDEAIDWTWASTREEIEAVEFVLKRFFTLENGVYIQSRIQEEIERYQGKRRTNSVNGKKGGRPKKKPDGNSEKPKKTQSVSEESEKKPITSNHEPVTSNHEPEKSKPLARSSPAEPPSSPPAVITLPTNRFNTVSEEFRVTADMVETWAETYPSVDIDSELMRAKCWLIDNPDRRKTLRGMRKFLGNWLSRQHDRGGSHGTREQTSGRVRPASAVDRVRSATGQ